MVPSCSVLLYNSDSGWSRLYISVLVVKVVQQAWDMTMMGVSVTCLL